MLFYPQCVLLVVSCDVCCQLALGVSLRQGLWLTCPLLLQLLYAFNFHSLASVDLCTYSLCTVSLSFPHLDHLAGPMFFSLVCSCSSHLLIQRSHSWLTILRQYSALQSKATHPTPSSAKRSNFCLNELRWRSEGLVASKGPSNWSNIKT